MSTPRNWFLPPWNGVRFGNYQSPQAIRAAYLLDRAAIESDNLGHDMREVAFRSWQIREPVMAEAVLLWMRNAMGQA